MTPRRRSPVTHQALLRWVNDIAAVTGPDSVEWCDGSPQERSSLSGDLLARGALRRRDPLDSGNRYGITDTAVSPPASTVPAPIR
ncbi:hypothetical protein [Actinomadura terrae]|uniref:hypothetical protein n=1 Tax=Actinomadura terrae TaxID=604353 RepID=UPI00355912AF